MKFLKLFLCLIAALSMQTECLAGCGLFNGFFVGATGGEAMNTSKISIEDNLSLLSLDFLVTSTFTRDLHRKKGQNIGWGEIFGGYGIEYPICCLLNGYLGFRAAANFSSFKIDIINPINLRENVEEVNPIGISLIAVKARHRTTEFTFDAKPGIVISEKCMLFALLGAAFNRAKTTFAERFTFSLFNTSTVSEFIELSKKGKHIHFHWGIGLEQRITHCLSLTASYTSTYYGKIRLAETSTFFDPATTTTFIDSLSATFKDRCEVISFGLSHYF
jgi:hypothetical protein